MPLIGADWTVDRDTGNVRYIGADHNLAAASYATVIEFHRWAQGLQDDAEYLDSSDELAISTLNPSNRSTDNIITLVNSFNIDDASSEHLYDGSIIQNTGDDIYDGIVNFGNIGVVIGLLQSGAVIADDWWNYGLGGLDDTSAGAAFMTDSGETFTVNEWVGYVIVNVTDGSRALITANTATTVTGILFGGTANTWTSGDAWLISRGLNSDAAQGISHRFMVKVRSGGVDTDARRLLGFNRTYLNTFGEFNISATARGNNVLALSDGGDLNNTTARAAADAFADAFIDRTVTSTTVNGVNAAGQAVLNVVDGTQFADGDFIMTAVDNHEYKVVSITVNALTLNRNLVNATVGAEATYILNIGFTQIDVDIDTTNEDYYAQWDRGAQTINGFFEYTKNLSAYDTDHFIYGLPGPVFRGITHEFDIDTPTGTFDAVEDVSWTAGTGLAGTGQMLAVDSPTAGTKMWVQLLTGGAPGDGGVITGGNSAATATVNVTVQARSALLTQPFVGQSTGSALIGSYGLTLQASDLAATDTVFDLTNAPITPPNNVDFVVNSVVIGEDRVLVAPWDGVTLDAEGFPEIDKTQMTLLTTLLGAAETLVVVTAAIPTDTPTAGTIRVVTDSGADQLVEYSSFTGSTFTINGTENFSGDNATGNGVWISYIDKLATAVTESFSVVFLANRNLVVLVRDGAGTPIKEFIAAGEITNTGGSISAIRTSDL